MKTDKPFVKSFTIGFIYYIVLVIILISSINRDNISYTLGYYFSTFLISSCIAGLIVKQSKKEWNWIKVGAVVLVTFLIVIVIQSIGRIF